MHSRDKCSTLSICYSLFAAVFLEQNSKFVEQHTCVSKGKILWSWSATFVRTLCITIIISACCAAWCIAVRWTHTETASTLQYLVDVIFWVSFLQYYDPKPGSEGTKSLCMHKCASYHEMQSSRLHQHAEGNAEQAKQITLLTVCSCNWKRTAAL